jgi:competence protein ComEC
VDGAAESVLAVLRFGSTLPGSTVFLAPPSPLVASLALGTLVAGLHPRRRLALLGAGLAVLFAACTAAVATPSRTELLFFDVGEGSAAILRLQGTGAVLLDAGCPGTASRAGERLSRNVLATGARSLVAVSLSHFHDDHVRGLDGLWARLPIRELWVSPFGSRSPRGAPYVRRGKVGGLLVRELARGDLMAFPGSPAFCLEVLHPDRSESLLPLRAENDLSLAFRLVSRRGSVLFLADLEEAGLARLLASSQSLEAEVLVAPHHGHANRLWPRLLERVRPGTVVVSGKGTEDAVEVATRLEADGRIVFATWRGGAIRSVWHAEEGWVTSYWRPE